MNSSGLISSAITLLLAGNLLAEAPKPVSAESVEKLIATALANHPELRSVEAEVAMAKGQRRQAGQWKNPNFSGEFGGRRLADSGGNLNGTGYAIGLAVTQTFEFPGKASLRKAIADHQIEIAELGVRQFRHALAGQIRSLALEYQAALIELEGAEEIRQRSSELIALLKAKPALTVSQLIETRVIEGSLLELKQSLAELKQRRDEARIELNTLLGRPTGWPLSISSPLAEPPAAGNLAKLTTAALAQNLQLQIRAAELRRAAMEVSASRLAAAPDFEIGPFYSREVAGDVEENLGGMVALPLPLWDRNEGNLATAEARRLQADYLLANARRQLEGEVAKRLRAYESSRALLAELSTETLDVLRENADLADRQFRTGSISVQLYLEAQQQFFNTRRIYHQTLLTTWQHRLDLRLLTENGENKP